MGIIRMHHDQRMGMALVEVGCNRLRLAVVGKYGSKWEGLGYDKG